MTKTILVPIKIQVNKQYPECCDDDCFKSYMSCLKFDVELKPYKTIYSKRCPQCLKAKEVVK